MFVMASARYPEVFESASAEARSYFNFHLENVKLNVENTTIQPIIMIETIGAIKYVMATDAIIVTISGIILNATLSVRDSNARLKRLTFWTRPPLKLFAKNVYECIII